MSGVLEIGRKTYFLRQAMGRRLEEEEEKSSQPAGSTAPVGVEELLKEVAEELDMRELAENLLII